MPAGTEVGVVPENSSTTERSADDKRHRVGESRDPVGGGAGAETGRDPRTITATAEVRRGRRGTRETTTETAAGTGERKKGREKKRKKEENPRRVWSEREKDKERKRGAKKKRRQQIKRTERRNRKVES